MGYEGSGHGFFNPARDGGNGTRRRSRRWTDSSRALDTCLNRRLRHHSSRGSTRAQNNHPVFIHSLPASPLSRTPGALRAARRHDGTTARRTRWSIYRRRPDPVRRRPPRRAERPNILFIMTDDHAAHAISAYGSRVNQTPHLDRLAREGALLRERLRHQLHLHAQPRGDPDRQVLPPERRHRVQPLRRLAHDRREAAAAGRLPHRHDRQVAPGQRSRPASTTGRSFRARAPTSTRSSTPRRARRRTPGYATDVITDLALEFLEKRPGQAVLPDAAPQGAAPAVGAGREARGDVRRQADSRAGDVLGRTPRAPTRSREPAACRRRPDARDLKLDAAAGPRRARSSSSGWREAGPR